MLSLLLFFAAAPAQFEDLELLDKKIKVFANAEPVDRRLKLSRCPVDPVITLLADDGVIVRCPAIGWRLRVNTSLPDGPAKDTPFVIRKGDTIECVISGPGFAVSAQVIALTDAGIGQTVRIKSLTSSVPMTAVVISPGFVKFIVKENINNAVNAH
jgi:flagella basal body P-ring formation protein FlgA